MTCSDRLGADVTLPAAGQRSGREPRWAARPCAPAVVLAATTSPSGSAGDFSATPLSEAGTWAEGGASGAFTYSYPISVPPVPGGLAPQVSLGYNSQAVDGLTSSTNDQASWIGDGWDYQPGYIERDYQSCEQNPCRQHADRRPVLVEQRHHHAVAGRGDDHAGGRPVQRVARGGRQRGQDHLPDRLRQQRHPRRRLLGGHRPRRHQLLLRAERAARLRVGRHHDQQRVDGTGVRHRLGPAVLQLDFPKSHCLQAWRWNLDYVTDSHGDAEAFFYNTETNYYAADNGGPPATPPTCRAAPREDRVRAAGRQRLRRDPGRGGRLHRAGRPHRHPDRRTGDLACSSGAACDVISPTFWSKYRADHDRDQHAGGVVAGGGGFVGAGAGLPATRTPRRRRRCGWSRSPAPARTARASSCRR